jgi:hypothetical protein
VSVLRVALLAIVLLAGRDATAQGVDTLLDRIDTIRSQLQPRPGGVLGIMGYNMSPDGAANALEIDRALAVSADGSSVFQLSQFGAGFTLSESFTLWLEGYMGTARYDPRAVFTGLGARRVPLRWNNITATVGVGYDIRLAEYLWLRPIFNLAGGYAASDASLFGGFLEWRFGADVPELTDKHVNAWGIGGSLVLAYYDHRPARDIDVELRYTQLRLATFGDTMREARGTSDAITVGLWARYRWPMGIEAFGRPVRWAVDGNFSTYLGDQRDIMGFAWAAKVGGGVELDIGRHEVGGLRLYLSRVRLMARYFFFADGGVTGTSVGLGFSF